MGYNKEILKQALDEIQSEGKQHKRRYELIKDEYYRAEPRLAEIDAEFLRLGPLLGITALAGNTERLSALRGRFDALQAEKEGLAKKVGLTEFTPICPDCNDTGKTATALCKCVLNRAKKLSFAALSADMPIDSCSFDTFSMDYYPDPEDRAVMQRALDFSREYAAELSPHSPSVLFFGGPGLGKTHLSLSIAAAALEKGLGTIYSPAQNLINRLEREHFSRDNDTSFLDSVLECDLLIIDDLGTEFSTSFTQAAIYNIINTRLLSNRPTLINTNLTIAELEDAYTSRVTSRILGSYKLRPFKGNDVRQQIRINKNRSEDK